MTSDIKDFAIWFYTLKPSKRVEFLYLFFQVLFSLVFSSFMYIVLIGDYTIINLFDYKELLSFILSGRIITCSFLFAISWVIYYEVGYILIKVLSHQLVNKILDSIWDKMGKMASDKGENIDSNFNKIIDKYLVELNAIKIEEADNLSVTKKGINYDKWIKIVNEIFRADPTKVIQKSYLTLSFLFQFNILYFCFIETKSNWFLDVIIIISLMVYGLYFVFGILTIEIIDRGISIVSRRLLKVSDKK